LNELAVGGDAQTRVCQEAQKKLAGKGEAVVELADVGKSGIKEVYERLGNNGIVDAQYLLEEIGGGSRWSRRNFCSAAARRLGKRK
jgi:hypothetical protein